MTFGVVIELGTGALLLYGIPFIIVVGWFSSRILGVHRGWGRSFVAGLLRLGPRRRHRRPRPEPEHQDSTHQLKDVLLLAFFFGVLVSMFVGLILDVILKPRAGKRHRWRGSCTRSRPSSGSSRRSAGPARSSATRASAGSPHCGTRRRRSSPRRSSRAAAAPHARGLRRHVREVRADRVDPHRPPPRRPHHRARPAAVVGSRRSRPTRCREVLESELGATVEEEFASFDFEPLAAASIGQTHRAVLEDRRAGGREGPAPRHRGHRRTATPPCCAWRPAWSTAGSRRRASSA